MQIFLLNTNPIVSAQSLADAHVRVICREITMLLSTWYYYNGPDQRLPYKPMSKNQPLIKQLSNPEARKWAIRNAGAIFAEFDYRFGKKHASEEKYNQLLEYITKYDKFNQVYTLCSWSFIGKGVGIFHNLYLHNAIEKYRRYYIDKINSMKVPCIYTKREPPLWINNNQGMFEKHEVWTYKKF